MTTKLPDTCPRCATPVNRDGYQVNVSSTGCAYCLCCNHMLGQADRRAGR